MKMVCFWCLLLGGGAFIDAQYYNNNYNNNNYNNNYDQEAAMDRFHSSLYEMKHYLSGGGDEYGCCGLQFEKIIPGIALVAVSYFLFFLLNRANNQRRKRDTSLQNEQSISTSEVLLDGPTWLSLVHELWEQDGALEDPSCAQETLCRMNRMAMAAPGQAGWAVSLSSMPLSYLLHIRHTGGFTNYMDASLMGRSGGNCTQLYSSCSRFH